MEDLKQRCHVDLSPVGAPLRRAGSEEGPSSGESYDFSMGALMLKLHTHACPQGI